MSAAAGGGRVYCLGLRASHLANHTQAGRGWMSGRSRPRLVPSSAASACASWAAGLVRTCPPQWTGPRPVRRRIQPMWAWALAVNQALRRYLGSELAFWLTLGQKSQGHTLVARDFRGNGTLHLLTALADAELQFRGPHGERGARAYNGGLGA